MIDGSLKPIDPGQPAEGWTAVVFAKDQPEYLPLPALRSAEPEGYVLTAWRLTWRQRLAILCGVPVFLTLLAFHKPLTPVMLDVGRPGWTKAPREGA